MAATTAIAGHGGSLVGPTGVTEIVSWSADVTQEALDATSMASTGWREFIIGLSGVTGSASCQGSAIPTAGASAGTLKTKATGGSTLTGSVLISRVGVSVPVDGKITYDVDFSFTGSVAIA